MLDKWIRDNCVLDKTARTNATELYEDYIEYVSDEHTQTMFGRELGKRFNKYMKKGKVYYKGIRLDR